MSITFLQGAINFAGGDSPKVKFFTVVARYVSPLDGMPVNDFSVFELEQRSGTYGSRASCGSFDGGIWIA